MFEAKRPTIEKVLKTVLRETLLKLCLKQQKKKTAKPGNELMKKKKMSFIRVTSGVTFLLPFYT